MRFLSKEIAVALTVLLLLPGVSHALTEPQKALVGLKGVYVVVGDMEPEAARLGLTEAQIKTDVELRLRKAGIRVLTEGWPHLTVNLTILIGSPHSSYNTVLSLFEPVTLDRGIRAYGSIWNTGYLGQFMTQEDMKSKIREPLGDRVDNFINDYLAANPKK
jgi:hypothetical protein